VLQGEQSVIDGRSNIFLSGKIIHTKNAALLTRFVKDLSGVKYSVISLMQVFPPQVK
jgi:ribosomal protein S12